MATATVSWSLNNPFSTAQTPGQTITSISGGSLTSPITQSGDSPQVFALVPDASPYVATVQMMDNAATPQPLGPPLVSQPFPVTGTVNAPSDISVTVA